MIPEQGKSIAFLIVLVTLLSFCIIGVQPVKASGNLWISRAPMPNGEYFLGLFRINGKIYAIGYNFNYVYDPSTEVWVSKTPIPTHQQGFAISMCQNKIYVIGGSTGIDAKTGLSILTGANEMYDPTTDLWEAKATLPTPTMNLQANVVDDKIYLISGRTNVFQSELSNATWVYDPSRDSWTLAASIPTPVYYFASAAIGSKIYVEGGIPR